VVYRPPYPWNIDPPTHGISTPLPMVYQTLSFGRNEGGSIYHEGVQNTMTKNLPQGQNIIGKSTPGFNLPYDTGFTYRLDKLKPRASTFKGPPAKVYTVLNTVIGPSHLCCHDILYFLSNPSLASVIFLTQLHSISEYRRILNTPNYLCLY